MKTSQPHIAHLSRLPPFILALGLAISLTLASCSKDPQSESAPRESGGFPPSSKADCLPNLSLTDQYGKTVSLATLKGKPVLFDFIYTHCPDDCLLMTARMRKIADKLGPDLGKNVVLVSVTVDPEHDGPKQLYDYAKAQGAERQGWIFLTGPPPTVDALMGRFNLKREREENNTVGHVLEFFLVAPNGRQLSQYVQETEASALAADALRAAEMD
ncbi:MAG TPA: SCO family protein [Candidatus Binataceae bacterium]|nr:SCO family protein [Candidatus Binataceae bacterium]